MATSNRAQRRREQFGSHRNGKASGWPTSAPNPVFHAHEAADAPETAEAPEQTEESNAPTKPAGSGQEAATVDQ